MNEKIIQNNIQSDAMFVFESETTPNEYGNMAVHFPRLYWQYARFGTVLTLSLVSVIGIISNQSKSESIISFLLLEVLMLIIYKIRLKVMAENSFEAIEFIRRKCKGILNISRKECAVKQIKNPEMLKKIMINNLLLFV